MNTRLAWLLVVGGIVVGSVWYLSQQLQPRPLPESPVARRPAPVVPGASGGELDYIRTAELVADPLERCKQYPPPHGFEWSREMTDLLCEDSLLPGLSRARVRNWIKEGQAEMLDAHFDSLLERYLEGSVPEGYFWYSYTRHFEVSDTAMRQLLDQWATERPDSAHAQLALAYHHLANAWVFRGDKYLSEVSIEDRSRMRDEVRRAENAAVRAIELNKRLLPAYSVPTRLVPLGAMRQRAESLAATALALAPDSYLIRVAMMFPATPMWGGSNDQMDAIAADGMRHVRSNPRMHMLKAEALGERAVPFHQDDRDVEASRLFEDALAHGPLVRFLRWGSVSQRESGNYARAVEYMSQTLRFFPSNEDVRVGRAVALAKLGLKDWALEELERVVSRGDNSNSYAVRQHVWLLINMTRFEETEARLLQLLPSDPGNRWVNLELAKLYLYRLRRIEKAKPHIDTLFAKNPDDGAALLLQVDYIQNTDGRGLRELAERFVLHADESDPEQKSALPKVKAWLATHK